MVKAHARSICALPCPKLRAAQAIRPPTDHRPLPSMQPLLQQHLVEIQKLCKAHHVMSLHAFGSILRQNFGPQSDVDFLVVFDRSHGQSAFAQFFGFNEDLEALLGRKVDLVSGRAIQNPFFQQEIDETKQSIYAA